MVTAQIPGINISILRQQTTTQRGVPLLISGRGTALRLPVPALVSKSLCVIAEGHVRSLDPDGHASHRVSLDDYVTTERYWRPQTCIGAVSLTFAPPKLP
jgi:hypothetical protein